MDVLDIVRRTEDAIRLQPFESLYVYDQNGILLLRKDGHPLRVQISPNELKLLRSAVVTHNHPGGLGYPGSDPRAEGNSFSLDDILTAAIGDVTEMRAVTPRVRYSMRPQAGVWPAPARIETAFNLADAETRTRLRADVQIGQLTIAEAEVRLYDEIWRVVARRLGLGYSKEHP